MSKIKNVIRFVVAVVLLYRMFRYMVRYLHLSYAPVFVPWVTIPRGNGIYNYGGAKWKFWGFIRFPMVRVACDRRSGERMVDTLVHELWHLKQLEDLLVYDEEITEPRWEVLTQWFGPIDVELKALLEEQIPKLYADRPENWGTEIEAFYVGKIFANRLEKGKQMAKQFQMLGWE